MNYCREMVVSSLRHGGGGGYRVLDTLFTKHLTTAMARYITTTRVPSSFFFLTRLKCVSVQCIKREGRGRIVLEKEIHGRVRFRALIFLHLFATTFIFRAETSIVAVCEEATDPKRKRCLACVEVLRWIWRERFWERRNETRFLRARIFKFVVGRIIQEIDKKSSLVKFRFWREYMDLSFLKYFNLRFPTFFKYNFIFSLEW